MLSKHRGIKLKMNNSKITGKSPRTQKLNNTLLNNTGLKKKKVSSQETRKRSSRKTESKQEEENNNTKADMNKIESRKTMEKIIKEN